MLRDTRAFGFFWSAVAQKEWPQDETTRDEIRSRVSGVYGDRRQELVLIGRGMNQAALIEKLNAALLTDAEYDQGPTKWQQMPDPFPKWETGDDASGASND